MEFHFYKRHLLFLVERVSATKHQAKEKLTVQRTAHRTHIIQKTICKAIVLPATNTSTVLKQERHSHCMHNEAHSILERNEKIRRTVHFVHFISFSNDERIIKMERAWFQAFEVKHAKQNVERASREER